MYCKLEFLARPKLIISTRKIIHLIDHGEIDNVEKYMSFSGHFDDHAGAAMQYDVHLSMEEVHGFTRSHWMPPLGKYLHRIAPVATMVINFGSKH
jgi:hypothetical protein